MLLLTARMCNEVLLFPRSPLLFKICLLAFCISLCSNGVDGTLFVSSQEGTSSFMLDAYRSDKDEHWSNDKDVDRTEDLVGSLVEEQGFQDCRGLKAWREFS